MAKFRRLNDRGITEFRNFYLEKISGSETSNPKGLLTDDKFSESINNAKDITLTSFETRYEFGEYLCEVTANCSRANIENDDGIWNWLTLFYFDKLYPSPRGGKEINRYILNSDDRRKWYRHLVRTNWDLVSVHGDTAKVVLTGNINSLGDETEQLISRQFIASNTNLLAAAEKLYYRPGKKGGVGRMKANARAQSGEGVIRRFIIVAQQLDLTYDLYSMEPDDIVDLLPEEFNSWLPSDATI